MTATYNDFAPGQMLKLKVTKTPQAAGAVKTIERLMRRDPENAKALRRSQKARETKNNIYVRGNRWWTSRAKAGRVVRVENDATWSMKFMPQIAPDLRSVEKYLSIEKA